MIRSQGDDARAICCLWAGLNRTKGPTVLGYHSARMMRHSQGAACSAGMEKAEHQLSVIWPCRWAPSLVWSQFLICHVLVIPKGFSRLLYSREGDVQGLLLQPVTIPCAKAFFPLLGTFTPTFIRQVNHSSFIHSFTEYPPNLYSSRPCAQCYGYRCK